MDQRIGLSIAICSHNRSTMLAACLEALAAADPPLCAFEVIVVANVCTDRTLEVAEALRATLPIRILEEETPGVSNARNRAIEAARGELIIWLDDDAYVRPEFLRAYEAASLRHPDVAIFGGTILPVFEGGAPHWLAAGLPAVASVFAVRTPSRDESFNGGGDTPYGANFAIRRSVQQNFKYDPGLGRRPGDPYRGGEETTLICALLALGYKGRWVPEAVVDHQIRRERQNENWIENYYWADGWRRAETARSSRAQLLSFRYKARSLWYRLLYRRARQTCPPEHWLTLLRRAAVYEGLSQGLRTRARPQGPKAFRFAPWPGRARGA